ncbi:MAG: excinuclease ABC subunit UvrB [Patescibacteria group bacterium]|jgi:excinuclease ABC subunit B|nr:excinuclease ABC subunit UvrB [Patescibacteria group bacterium]
MEKNKFVLRANYSPQGDQPEAIKKLKSGLDKGLDHQTLLGVTGSGKTFTMAKIIEYSQKPTLVISHNKTLAAQLYDEFKGYFPDNAVNYFVSYYDYYQPEAYVPRTDTYIEKDASVNEEIDRLRNAATSALLSRSDTLIIASVSCIYGLGEPEIYENMSVELSVGEERKRDKILRHLTDIQYDRNDKGFERGKIRVRGDVLDIFPSYEENAVRLEFFGDKIDKIKIINPLTGEITRTLKTITIFPAKHFVTPKERLKEAISEIKEELEMSVSDFKRVGKHLEAERLEQRTNYDMEMLEEIGYCSGVENYSRYLSNRRPGEQPATLIDYFPDDFLVLIDESHMTIPQIRGMYRGDRSRKETLVNYGFRLPSALDNRPLRFHEFEEHIKQAIYVSATPGEYELSNSTKGLITSSSQYYEERRRGLDFPGVSEQVIRPTGLVDPKVEICQTEGQIDNLIEQIRLTTKKKQRVLVTTLTKRMAEELAQYLSELDIRVKYLHSEIHTLERPEILRELRLGLYDVLVGINLLREGIDLPEVSLVAILDADKEGFLRSEQALIQTIGRAARHVEGRVIMYADNTTDSMKRAISETERRRTIQTHYNEKHGITPTTIKKKIAESMRAKIENDKEEHGFDISQIPKDEVERLIRELERKMDLSAKNFEFEKAAGFRDQIKEIRAEIEQKNFKNKLKKS